MTTTQTAVHFARRTANVRPSAIRELLRLGANPEVISFGGGYPDPALFPVEELAEIYGRLLMPAHATNLQYTASNGLPQLRAQVAARMNTDGIDCDADDILIIQGAQQGLDLTARLLVDPGDVIITEDPTFLGALIAFAPTEPHYAVVRTDEHGIDTDHLADVLAVNPSARLIYTMPEFQNPTGITLSLERRHRLIELANQHDLIVLEDTPYRALRYEGTSLPTLKSLDTEGRVIHLGSFSKILAPSMRLGWVVAAPAILEKLALLKLAADTQNSTLNMAATSDYLSRYDIDAHLAQARPVYRHKRDLMLATLGATLPEGVSYTHSEGGLFTWLAFPQGFDAGDFMADVLLPQAKVAYVPGGTFFPIRQQPNHARLSFSGIDDDRLVQGITALGNLLTEHLR
ncbi:MAG: PLP-dependent aminotransferase family protein [Microlunatus sp.]